MRSGPSALTPLRKGRSGEDFEEDTLLPPPVPGLLPQSAEHVFDPPTWPGIGLPRLNVEPPAESTHSDSGIPHAIEYAPEADRTPRTATPTGSLAEQTVDVLPPLPVVPSAAAASDLLSYLFRVGLSRWQRRRIVVKTERRLSKDGRGLDRLLTDLGQHAFIEQVDLLSLYAPPEPQTEGPMTPAVAAAKAESWAARIDAEQWRMLAVLTREEARLTSDLLRWVDAQRQDRTLAAEPALHDEFELLLGRLAAVRVERWVQERARSLCHRNASQLQHTLVSILLSRHVRAEERQVPNLLLLGALLACQRSLAAVRPVEPWFTTVPGRPSGVELSPALFASLWRFQDSLLPRVVLCARASVERLAYDDYLLRRALIFIAVLLGTGIICAIIAAWGLSLF